MSKNRFANLMVKSKAIVKYIAYSNVAKIKFRKQFREISYKLLFICLYPVGKMYYYNMKNKNDDK